MKKCDLGLPIARAIRLTDSGKITQVPCDISGIWLTPLIFAAPKSGGVECFIGSRRLIEQISKGKKVAVYLTLWSHSFYKPTYDESSITILGFGSEEESVRSKALIIGHPGDIVAFKTTDVIQHNVQVTLGSPNEDALLEVDTHEGLLQPIKHAFKLISTDGEPKIINTQRSIHQLENGDFAIRRESDKFTYAYEGVKYPLDDFISGGCCWLELFDELGVFYGCKITKGNATVLPLFEEWPSEVLFIAAENGAEVLLYATEEQTEQHCLKLIFWKDTEDNIEATLEPVGA